jgi:hypothetical protein
MADNLGGTAVIPSLVLKQGTVFLFCVQATTKYNYQEEKNVRIHNG